jgi:hypothetical protein
LVEDELRKRIEQLLGESTALSRGDEYDQCLNAQQVQLCSAWLTAAQNAVQLVCQSPEAPYRQKVDKVALENHGYAINAAVGEVSAVLRNLISDADSGLIASITDRARAETFDDFLDHADAYLQDSRKNEAGVIAGVVFEDTIRRICTKHGIVEKGQKLDSLISKLASIGEFTAVRAKRARAAADVRTKATHAQWDEFEVSDVQAAVDFTRDIIATKLDK